VSLHLHWFLPTSGDGRDIPGGHHTATGTVGRINITRRPDIEYLAQIARSAEQLGFEAVLTPTGTWCEDAWLTTAALTRETTRLKFLVAFRPGVISPTLAAQMAATYQRLSGGRLLLNVVTGGDAVEQHRFGDWLGHDERYERTDEFLTVVRGVWSGEPFDFTGRHYTVAGAQTLAPPDPVPGIFFGGASTIAQQVAAKHVDTYLTWGEPPADVAARLDNVRSYAAAAGRTLTFGIRLHVISRDTAAEAWAEANAMVARLDPEAIARAQAAFNGSESVGQKRMAALAGAALGPARQASPGRHNGRTDRLEIYPNLWAGYGLVRGGAGTALVGSHEEVAERIAEYHALGLDHFILSGQPHLEEAYWFGEGVIPLLRERGLLAGTGTEKELVSI
jgi:alkanesulfonate monooxygenase